MSNPPSFCTASATSCRQNVSSRKSPGKVLPIDNVLDAYKHFDQHDEGWTKVELRAPSKAF
jgi:hypothetical protein